MDSRRRQVLAVILATVVVAVGVVVVVTTSVGTTRPATGFAVFSVIYEPLSSSTTRPYSSEVVPAPPPTLTVDSGCRVGEGPRDVTPVPAEVAARVDRAWTRIETWLAANAPVSAASLRPPADDAAIAETQRMVGVRLPAELVASLRRHDGVPQTSVDTFVFPPFMHPLPATDIADEAKMMCGVLEDLGQDDAVGPWWHGQYVPLAVDHGGDSLFLDADARLGRQYHESGIDYDGPASLTELLEQTADALNGGGPLAEQYRPVVEKGLLGWS
jgi:cell wall assembly regulator SMI1